MSQAMKLAGPFWQAKKEKLEGLLFRECLMIVALLMTVFFDLSKTTGMFFVVLAILVVFVGLFLYTLHLWWKLRRNFSVSD